MQKAIKNNRLYHWQPYQSKNNCEEECQWQKNENKKYLQKIYLSDILFPYDLGIGQSTRLALCSDTGQSSSQPITV